MSGPCERCPCPTACERWDVMCSYAAEDPPDPVSLRWICERSRGDVRPAITTVSPSIFEAILLTRRMNACEHRTGFG